VCDKCGLEQAYRTSDDPQALAPCEGLLGLICDSETCVTVEAFEEGW